jgi:precorrin-6A/cobalt-precorrin-6A reductase
MQTPPVDPGPADGRVNRPLVWPRPRLWLIAGTGEGPALAKVLLARGWRLKVSVVTGAATRAYPPHPDLELAVGPLGGGAAEAADFAVSRQLLQARDQGDPFQWMVDATHPFARQISATLATVCRRQGQPLLRLWRPGLPTGRGQVLNHLDDLSEHGRPGEHLLLAIGARRLAEAIRLTPWSRHHARVLPSPQALRQALAAGLATDRLACLRPGPGSLPIELALCRRWRIDSVLCRQSGGDGEARWHHVCDRLGLRLLLLRRPSEPGDVTALALAELLARIGSPLSQRSPSP